MGAKSKIRLLTKISLPKFIWYNFFSKKVERQGKGFLIPYKHSSLDLEKGAKIILHDGNFIVNYYLPKHSKAEAYVRMSEGAKLEIFGRVSLYYKATIEVKKRCGSDYRFGIHKFGGGYIGCKRNQHRKRGADFPRSIYIRFRSPPAFG